MANQTNTIEPVATEDVVMIPSAEAISDLHEAFAPAEEIPDTVRGSQKKKRNAVRKAFMSATNGLIIEAATLLGIVKTSWELGTTQWVSIDFRTFKDKNLTPEDLGLFLGIKDKFRSIGMHSNTVCFSSAGHVHAYCVQIDQAEQPKA